MALETILTPTSFTSTTVSLPTSAGTLTGYGYSQYGAFSLVPGQKYKVVWNGTDWPVTAMDASSLIPGAVAMGNMKLFNPPGTGEPFLIGEIDGLLMILCIDAEGPDTYTVTIYAEVEDADKPSFDIVLKDRDGTDVVYPTTVVRLKTNDGAVRKFVNEDSVPVPVEKNDVEVDFSQGNMEIVPDAGNVFSKVTLNRPAELIPANIPEGMYIAGVGPGEYGATGEEIEEAACVFSVSASGSLKVTSKQAGDKSITLTAIIPLSSKIHNVLGKYAQMSQSNTTNLNYPAVGALEPARRATNNASNGYYAVSESEKTQTITYKYNNNFYNNYGSMAAHMVVVFSVPGIKIKKNDDDVIFCADDNVVSLPENGRWEEYYAVTKLDLSESAITDIPQKAFWFSSSVGSKIKTVLFPKGVKTLGNQCFYNCSSLTEMVIPNTVTTIGSQAFYWCTGLTKVIIPDGVKSLGQYCFQACSGLTEIEVPNSVTSLGASCFSSCSKLEKADIRAKVATIGTGLFSSCTSLTDATLPDSLTAIPTSTFYGCTALSQLAVPSGVTSIGAQAFYGCKTLAVLDCSACTSVPTLDNTNAFTNCPSTMQIKVPAALYDSWKAATNWSTYASKIVAV